MGSVRAKRIPQANEAKQFASLCNEDDSLSLIA